MNIPLPIRSSVFFAIPLLIIGMLPSQASAQAELTMAKAIEVLNEISLNPKSGPPRPILLKAEGIAIIPDQLSAGFVFGAKYGKGIVLVRRPDGGWSNPVFINAFGGSFGLQAGAEATDLVLVFKGRKSVENFLKGKGKLTMGIDATAAAGPIGRNFEAGTDLAFKAEILSYSRSRGIFAGVSAAGGTLSLDRKANSQYYGIPVGSTEILADNAGLKPPDSAAILQRLLASQTGVPVVRKGKTPKPVDPTTDDDGTVTIEGESDTPVIVTPKTSRRSTTKDSSGRSASRSVKKTPPTDDDVMLAAGESDESDDTPAPKPTAKTKSTSWKKSASGSTSQSPSKAALDKDIEEESPAPAATKSVDE